MRIGICDGNASERKDLIDILRAALARESVSCQVREYSCARELVYDVEDGECVDAVFADLATKDAWESVLALRKLRYDGFLILMSDCGERVVEGYAIEADGYLTKPFKASHVCELLARLCARTRKACLTVQSSSRIVRVPYHEIVYIESRNARCVIHRTDATSYTVYAHLDDLEAALEDGRFLRCHQSYLVNMDHIVSADKAFVMTSGEVVSIRQRECRRIREEYLAYVCGR